MTFAAYIPAIRAGFIWDDDTFLLDNPLIKAEDGLYRFWFTTEPPDYFPLTSTSLWLEWRLWGAHPTGYHVVNVLLHATSAVLIWRVLGRLGVPGAWWAAAIFAVHPVNVESVAWITERKNVLPLVFYVLSMLLYLRFQEGGKRGWYVLSLGAFLLALLGKTSVAMLPLVLVGCVWWKRGRVLRRDLLGIVPYLVLSVVLSMVTVWFQYHRAIRDDVVRTDGFLSRLAGAGWAVWFYLYKALVPYHLCFVYPRWQIDASNPLSYLPGLLLLGCLGVFWRYRRGWARGPLFAMGYYVVSLFPVMGFFNIYFMLYSLVADHWQYVAIIGPIALVAGWGTHAFSHGPRALRIVGVLSGIAVLGVLSVQTWRQASIYKNVETLWQDTLAKNPDCWMAHYSQAILAMARGDPERAKACYLRALRIQPDYAPAHSNLACLLAEQGQYDQAVAHHHEALRLAPNRPDYHSNLGTTLSRQGKLPQAVEHFRRALELRPGDPGAGYGLGLALDRLGDLQQAIDLYTAVIRLHPDHVEARKELANAFAKQGRTREAIQQYEEVLARRADWAEPLNNLAWLLATAPDPNLRDGARALRLAQRACELTGYENADYLDTSGVAYAEAGLFDEAIRCAEKAIDLAIRTERQELADKIRRRVALYQSGRPFHQGG